MTKFKAEPGKIAAAFNFPKKFLGFQGHFPEQPILPGICEIQAVCVMLESAHKHKINIQEIVTAKFFSPVSAQEKIEVTVEEEKDQVKALIKAKDKKIAEIHLKIMLEK